MSGRLSSHASGTDGDGLMPIAVVGMSCRLSGIATNPEGLWQMLARGLTGWSSNGSSRFQTNSFWHPQSDLNASFNARGFHLIKQDPALFDHLFFGVTSIEARAIDPQQRMLLEVAYEAFETAGITMQNLKGSDTGVYCAVSHHDYDKILGRDPELSPGYRFTGTGPALVSNRISYVLDLHGPSITLDTACSGGLVAVHEACKAIRAGDVPQALVGGTNLILDPDQVNIMSSMDFLSPHGRCYAFDSRADGFGRGEGVAAVVLKRLDMALGDGDPIRAVIRGSSVCSDGRTPGVTMPSSDIQRRMIQRAYQQAGLDPRDTTYVEAHGTGTKAGDKAEATALHETFCKARQEGNRLFVGSVKGNVGHTESVAGLTGLIKTVLMLEKKMIPPNATFMKPNSEIPLESWGMEVPKRMLKWPENATRRASVNSFGYGGTNAHVILDAADDYLDNMKHMCPPVDTRASGGKVNGDLAHKVAEVTETSSLAMTIIVSDPTEAEPTTTTHVHGHSTLQHRRSLKASPTKAMTRSPRLFPLSHDQEGGVAKIAANFKRFILDKLPDTNESLDSFAFTLSDRRSMHRFRWCVTASSRDELVDGLEHIVEGTDRALQQAEERNMCFAFTGQGAQWAGMGRELLAAYPVFAKSMERSEKYLTHLGADWRLLAELDKPWETSRINEAALSQPCCTAIQIGLVDLLETWGIRPALVCGHSSGEIAAAYAAGIMTAQDCLKVAYFRGHLVRRLKEQNPKLSGGMLAVGLSVGEAQKYLDNDATCGKVVVACVNSPASITLSGDEAVLSSIQETLAARGVFNRKLAVDVAYHSHHMNMILEDYLHAIQDIKPLHCGQQHVQMVSSVTGKAVQGEELNATYWGRNLTCPVLFADALAEIFDTAQKNEKRSNMLAVVEVGPHSALQGPIKQTIKASSKTAGSISYHSVLSRKQDASRTAVALAASLFVNGATVVDFGRVNDPHGDAKKNVLTNLPTYNWHHNTTHWVESRRSAQYRHRKFPKHDLVGVPSSDSIPSEPTWRNYIRLKELPWLKGHCIGGNTIFPAAGYVTMVLEALKQQILGGGNPWKKMRIKFRQVHFGRALLVADDSVGVETFVTIRPFTYTARESSTLWNEFRIFSVSVNGESTEHSRGLVTAISPLPNQDHENMTDAESLAFIEQVSEKTRIVLPPKQLYKELKDVGIEYSHPFNGQEHIRASESASTCRIKIPDIQALMPSHYQQPHCIHPATLDVCFQAAFSAMKVGENLGGTFVLGGFDDLEISSEIPSQPGKHMSVAASLRGRGHSNFASDSVISSSDDDGKPQVFIKIKGLILARTSGPSRQTTSSQHLAGESLCHRLEWSLDPTCAEPHSIIKRCLVDSDVLVAGRTSMYEQYCQAVVARALTELSPDDEAKITGHFSQWLLWMKSISAAGSYQALQMGNALNDKIKSLGIYGEVLVDMAPRLVGILRGDVDPQALLLEKQRLYRLYTRDNIKRCHKQLAEYVKLLRFKTPHLRILEIGAATADGSMPVLEALYSNKGVAGEARSESYTLACAPTAFFQDAEEEWDTSQKSPEWKRLDMEISPKEQGFELGSYDLVIAANVLHATREINVALRNMRSLLKSNGKLALMETTAPKIHDGVVFGMLPGWWLVGATDGRVHSPLLDASGWRDRLSHCGFSGIDFEMHDFDSAEDHQVSVMVSSATSHPEPWCLGMQDATRRGVSTLESELPISKYPTNLTGSEGGPRQTILVISDGKESRLADHVADLLTSSVESSVHAEKTALAEAQVSPGQLAVVLLEAVHHPFLSTCSQADWGKVRHILSDADGVLWVSCGGAVEGTNPLQSLIVGLTRCLRSEDQHRKVVTLDLEPNHGSGLETAEQIRRVYHHVFGPHGPPASALPEFEYAIRNGEILIPRLMRNSPVNEYVQDSVSTYHPRHEQGMKKPGRALSLKIHEPGLLNTLYWADSARHARSVGAEEVRVDLQYVSLNFKDIMIAMGQLEGHTAMLLEGSGKVVEVGEALRHQYSVGDLVFATDPDGVATTSVINKCNVHHIPRKLSMQVATAISLAYATALYSLRNVANLQEGESILIHSGAGAVGQAAISLAQYLNAGEIYVTVGSADKRALVRERFNIPDDKIFSSRGLGFYHQILRKTNGHGVDVILNSLSGEALQKSCSLLAPFGRFVEIGKKDVISNARLEMASLESNATFTTVDLTLLAKRKPLVHQELYRTIFELVGQDRIKVLSPITVNPVSELETSFRLMQAGKHVGKLLLELDPGMTISVQPPRPPTPRLKGDCSYLVVGGTGGLGRATMKHFASLGAKHIFTLSRSGPDSPIMRELVEEMRLAGVCVVVFKGSVTDTVAIESIKEQAREFPIRGVVQGAMVLQDSRVDNMSYAQWRAAMEPKVVGTMNLHRVFGDTLDFFILLSSSAGIIGSYAQGNYSAGNTFQDSLARHRASLGLPARSIDVGSVEGEGYTANNEAAAEFVSRQGLRPYKVKEFLATINEAIRNPFASGPSAAQLICGTRRADPSSQAKEAALQRPDPKFSHIWMKPHRQASAKADSNHFNIQAMFESAKTADEAEKAMQVAIKKKLAHLLGLPEKDVSTNRSVVSYGVDSLIAVELRNWILSQLESHVQIFELMSPMSFAELANTVARRSRLVATGLFGNVKV